MHHNKGVEDLKGINNMFIKVSRVSISTLVLYYIRLSPWRVIWCILLPLILSEGICIRVVCFQNRVLILGG